MESQRVKLTVRDGIAEVSLNRPDKMNALDLAMFEAIAKVGEELRGRADLRAVVLSGEGATFCAGLDLSLFADGVPVNDLVARTHGIANLFQQAAWVWRELPVPVVAAIQGVAFGGGLQIMSGADVLFIHPQTQLSIMEIQWGIVPDMAGTQLWKKRVRDDLLRELAFSGRRFNGEQAVAYGFATHCTEDPKQAASNFALDIAGKNPDAIRALKRLLNRAGEDTPAEGLLRESREQQKILGSPNQMETALARIEKRPPDFSDPV